MNAYVNYHPSQPQLPPLNQYPSHSSSSQNYLQQPRPNPQQYPPSSGAPSAPDRFGAVPQAGAQAAPNGVAPTHFLGQQNQQYQQPQGYPPSTTSASSFPQRTLAPAIPRDQQSQPANYPPAGYTQAESRPPTWAGTDQLANPAADPKDPSRTHVVGQQGRRGILPSAPGRPAVAPNPAAANNAPNNNNNSSSSNNNSNATPPANSNGSKNAAVPAKDADGKFPCPNCNKTYLHAKHLKRHMLRHTGDRPYMCVLCKDTFSRSDILKRHFQKCSVRRGNPTGASHLSNPAAHLKKSQAAANKSATASISSAENTPTQMGGAYANPNMSNAVPPNSAAYADATSMAHPTAQTSASSIGRTDEVYPTGYPAAPNPNWQRMTTKQHTPMMFHPASNSPDHFAVSSSSEDKRSILAGAPPPQNDQEWMYSGGQDQYLFQTSMGNGYDSMTAHAADVKKEFDGHEAAQGNNYYVPPTTFGADGTLGPGPLLWTADSSQDDPVQLKANQLVDFCFPGGIQESLHEQEHNARIRLCLTTNNVKHFLTQFRNFQGHFPHLHIPTFNFTGAYEGLILSIVCIGAVYSDRASDEVLLALRQCTQAGIERTSTLYQQLRDPNTITHEQCARLLTTRDLEQIQAILLMQVLFLWHGNPNERHIARQNCPRWGEFARCYHMLEPNKLQDRGFSTLHNLQPGEQADPAEWNWYTWVEQEKRHRLMFFIFLLDAGLCVWFNIQPQLDPTEIRLPLPSDDAPWEARSGEECAKCLGLKGTETQAVTNPTGSQRLKQPEMHLALASLFNPSSQLMSQGTNAYSKFILVHATLVHIWQAQRDLSLGAIPRLTFDQSSGASLDTIQLITVGLSRFKQTWDHDMQLQYPPQMSFNNINPMRRVGFCRDGVLFYWLARALINPTRQRDWQVPPDQRSVQIMHLLKHARVYSQSDSAQRGEEPGSVSHTVEDRANTGLDLHLKKLFRPINELYEPAAPGFQEQVHTY
ncbi:MAG: hypothetical protein Q9160_007794 [Pyrenula sp. 1 TL-2023]